MLSSWAVGAMRNKDGSAEVMDRAPKVAA